MFSAHGLVEKLFFRIHSRMSSFFLPKGKRRTTEDRKGEAKKKRLLPRKSVPKENRKNKDDEILSDDPDVEGVPGVGSDEGYPPSPEDNETAEEKRLRLAKKYLEEIEREERKRAGVLSEDEHHLGDGDTQPLHSSITKRLKQAELEEAGKFKQSVAENFSKEAAPNLVQEGSIRILRDHNCHKQTLTCLTVSCDGKYIVSGSKDAGLVMWDFKTGEKLARFPGGRKGTESSHIGHCSTINAVAISTDSEYLATGDNSKLIHIWKITTDTGTKLQKVYTFKGHRDSISGLVFRKKTHSLYSCAYDRSIKIWNLDEMAYVETLFGHQDRITGIDAGIRERAVSAGGRDGSVRVWKIVEESQLIFNGPSTSIDAVKLINEEHFITCGEDGLISLWSALKKKPLSTIKNAHGKDPVNQEPRWISALATLPSTDLFATGSHDGFIRLWECSNNFKNLKEINSIPLVGFINALAFTQDGAHIVAAVGQEHRLGRWWRMKEARNSIAIIPLNPRKSEDK